MKSFHKQFAVGVCRDKSPVSQYTMVSLIAFIYTNQTLDLVNRTYID